MLESGKLAIFTDDVSTGQGPGGLGSWALAGLAQAAPPARIRCGGSCRLCRLPLDPGNSMGAGQEGTSLKSDQEPAMCQAQCEVPNDAGVRGPHARSGLVTAREMVWGTQERP